MADRLIVEISEEDAERISDKLFDRFQSMLQSGEAPRLLVPKLLKPKQVAEILDFPLTKVQSKIRRAEIPSLRFDDKTIRVDPRELLRYIEAHPNLQVNRQVLDDHLAGAR